MSNYMVIYDIMEVLIKDDQGWWFRGFAISTVSDHNQAQTDFRQSTKIPLQTLLKALPKIILLNSLGF